MWREILTAVGESSVNEPYLGGLYGLANCGGYLGPVTAGKVGDNNQRLGAPIGCMHTQFRAQARTSSGGYWSIYW